MRILFRCDASPTIGGGHVMRCLAAAETFAWGGWSCVFAVNPEAVATVSRLSAAGHGLTVLADGAGCDLNNTDAVVIDSYAFDAAYERRFLGAGRTVIAFDDLADRERPCDVVLDPTPGRTREAYAGLTPPGARFLLGPRYVIVARTWRALRSRVRTRLGAGGPVRRILVSLGLTDPGDATSRVVTALGASRLAARVDVVLGRAAPFRARVEAALGANMTLHVDPDDFPGLAAEADLAIGAPSTSSFERATIGLPAVLIQTADNQRYAAAAFADAGAGRVVSSVLLDRPAEFAAAVDSVAVDEELRMGMSRRAASLTDGRGTVRLLAALAGDVEKSGRRIGVRLAEQDDEEWLLELQRQEPTRRHARNPQPPTKQEHAAWFARTCDDIDRILAIVTANGERAGMLRLDRLACARPAFEVSIAVDESLHRAGVGGAALSHARALAPGAHLFATVLPENSASLALFAAAGYRPEGRYLYRSRAA